MLIVMTIKYPYLPDGRNILYVSSENSFMREARVMCEKHSTEGNHPTGAVVVLNGEVVGRGANQAAFKNTWLYNFHKTTFCVRRFFKVASGTKYWLCPGCAPYSAHGEAQAVADALRNKGNVTGADLYLYGHWWCCKPCWDAMISAGIQNVYLLEKSEVLFK